MVGPRGPEQRPGLNFQADSSELLPSPERDLEGLVILFTGTGDPNGIGAHSAKDAARRGTRLLLTSTERSQHEGLALAQEINQIGGEVLWVPSNYRRPDFAAEAATLLTKIGAEDEYDMKAMASFIERLAASKDEPTTGQLLVDQAVKTYGRLDGVVHVAGYKKDASFTDLTLDDWITGFEINLLGPVDLTKAAVEQMRRQDPKGGFITIVSSIIALDGNIGQSIYAAMKAAQLGWIKSYADELKLARRDRIRINAILPGLVEKTRMTGELTDRQVQRLLEKLNRTESTPMDDVVQAISYFASPRCNGANREAVIILGGENYREKDLRQGEQIPLRDHSYDRFASHPSIMEIDTKTADLIPAASGVIIDNGCGTGAMTGHLLKLGKLVPPFGVIGIDPDTNALEIARRKYEQHSSDTQYTIAIEFKEGVSEQLPVPDKIARAVIHANAIHLADVPQAYRENFRVLQPGGILAVSSGYVDGIAVPEGPDARFWGNLIALGRRNLKALGYEGPVGTPENLYKYSQDDHVRMAEEAGFTDIETMVEIVKMNAEVIEAICVYSGFAEGALPGVPVEIAVEALIKAIPEAFARTNRGRDGTAGNELITEIRRGWLLLRARKPFKTQSSQLLPQAA